MITVCRVRPAEAVTAVWAGTRRRQGAAVVEVPSPGPADVAGALEGGLLPVSVGMGTDAEPAAWVAGPAAALDLAERGVPGWRITLLHEGPREMVLDAMARSGAAFLRTGRRRVAEAASLASVPGVAASVSVFVDSVHDAVVAVETGAGDLLLRDWPTEDLGRLREALGGRRLVERAAFPPGVGVDQMRDALPGGLLAAALDAVDASGAARPHTSWAPGKAEPAPVPAARLSAEWGDDLWREAGSAAGPDAVSGERRDVLERSLDGTPPTRDEVEVLFRARGVEVEAIAAVADVLRERAVGDTVTYVTNRNINYTNQCTYRCGFCAFSKGPRSLNLRGEPYLLEIHEVARRAAEAWHAGAGEVCLQGGIHPAFTGDFYVRVVEAVKEAAPGIHVHGFTPLEVWQGAETLGVGVREFLTRLRDAGLGTLPGTAAEILDDRVRRHLCPDKIRTAQWAEVMMIAHELGLRSTATIMFGHIDDAASWANHIEVVRAVQLRTGGFTEFVPLPFVHMGAPIYLQGRARPGPTWDEVVLVHAVARIALDGLIPNVQASWVKLGLDGAGALLRAGCNDLGGTLMEETISASAGASHGSSVTASQLEETARAAGRSPARRTTLYRALEPATEPWMHT
jgi:FO synthase